jgi:hypothetical protein
MALRLPLEQLEPPHRPRWKSQLISAQFGPMAEDLLAVSLAAAAAGSGTVARPLVDRGIDLYFRRLRSLLVLLIQVKAFRLLSADGVGTLLLPVSEVTAASNGYLALVHLPAPYDQLYRWIFLIPFAELVRRYPRTTSHGLESFAITADFARLAGNEWSDFAVDLDDLPHWLEAIPGWSDPVAKMSETSPDVLDSQRPGESEWEAAVGHLWVADELERAGRMSVVVAEDRVRLDTLTLLIHDLEKGRFAGLHVRTQRVSSQRTLHFEVVRPTFFVDERLFVLLLLLRDDARPADYCLLMPSEAIAQLGYSETITVDPLTKKFEPYRVPTSDVAVAFLKAAIGRG